MAEATCDKGTEEITEGILNHRKHLLESEELVERRKERARLELVWAAEDFVRRHLENMDREHLNRLVDDLAQRKTSPRSVALDIITAMSSGG
jgi:putative protein kinase ArgK-like GTPase of G3E family